MTYEDWVKEQMDRSLREYEQAVRDTPNLRFDDWLLKDRLDEFNREDR